MRIDAHQHFWHYDPVRDSWITEEMSVLQRDFLPDDLRPLLDAQGVAATVAVQADQSEKETQFLLQLAESNPFVRGVVGWVDLLAANLGERLEYFSQFERLCGFRHIAQAEADDFLAREDVARGIRRLSDFGFTYDILVYHRQLPAAVSLVEKLPDSRFVVDHLAKPPIKDGETEPWATHIGALAEHPNVWCKVSGMVTEADWAGWRNEDVRPYLDIVFETFGPDRLMFGSDWPVCLLAADYRKVRELVDDYASQFPASEREKLFGGNAAQFYGLAV
ncbi:MAG: amidohydrolase family protein [Gemmatimonadales bacterium]|jgi:L-fuconolactonase